MTQREIKFRAWDKKKMISWEELQEEIHPEWSYFVEDDNWKIMQFTGLHDKNGKEIYESDIVKVPDSYDLQSSPSTTWQNEEVFWNEDRLCWFLAFGKYDDRELYKEKDIEIIGNIYENPELLKK